MRKPLPPADKNGRLLAEESWPAAPGTSYQRLTLPEPLAPGGYEAVLAAAEGGIVFSPGSQAYLAVNPPGPPGFYWPGRGTRFSAPPCAVPVWRLRRSRRFRRRSLPGRAGTW